MALGVTDQRLLAQGMTRKLEPDGEKLMLMRGTGPLAGLCGGEAQRQGVEALSAWLAER